MNINKTISQKLNILLLESNTSDRQLMSNAIMESCHNPQLKFAENMQDALTLSSVHYFDFILLESTIADNINISSLKRLYLFRSYMPCIIVLSNLGGSQYIEMKHPGAGGCIQKKGITPELVFNCLTGLLNLRIPGIIQPFNKAKPTSADIHLMTITEQLKEVTNLQSESNNVCGSTLKKSEINMQKPESTGKLSKVKKYWSHLNILIAEDNDINRFIIEKMIKSWGVKMTLTTNGIETVAQFSQSKFDMVLLDIEMPGLNGYDTAKAIRNELKNKEVAIIAMTGHLRPEEKEKCLKCGMNDFISKPFTEKTLMNIIEKWQPAVQTASKK